MAFENSQWIWLQQEATEKNEYADFSAVFTAEKSKKPALCICSKAEYAVYVNGMFVGFQQFGDFPTRKVYDEYDLTDFVVDGENLLSVVALSKNYNSSSHIANGKGLIFEITDEQGLVLASDEKVLSRLSRSYRSGPIHNITGQLGMSFYYDCAADESWISTPQTAGENGFAYSVVSDKKIYFIPRPVPRLCLKEKVAFKDIGKGIYDGGKELVGQLYFEIESDTDKELDIHYGEHIVDGGVRYAMGGRNFTVHFHLKKGVNRFMGWFLRFGLRYLQLADTAVKVNEIGIIPAVYPLQKIEYTGTAIPKEIYDTSAYTLECCVHDHYEDCPWREQAQYTMDSRTQILCGYMAFNETKMPAAALRTMSYYLTDNGTFCITSPGERSLSIPNFSLVYPLMLCEYYEKTKDVTVLADVYENTLLMMEHYIGACVDGLLPMQAEWNFFEWEEDLHNEWEIFEQVENREKFPLSTNAYLILALECFAKVCEILGKDGAKYLALAKEVRSKAHDAFYCPENGLFHNYRDKGVGTGFSEYGQVFALYAHIATEEEEGVLLDVLTRPNDLTPLTLNNYIYKYEVLLQKSGYEQFVRDEINRLWGYMLEQGATTFWETIKGDQDFALAGSLCHGWSAVPIYVAHVLDSKK